MKTIKKNDPRLAYPRIFNLRPIFNEVSKGCCADSDFMEEECFLDDYYGTLYSCSDLKHKNVYGVSNQMKYYDCMGPDEKKYEIIDELRVPFRKIPIYKVSNNDQAKSIIDSVKKYNPDYQILFRGQGKCYTIHRSDKEKELLYGDSAVKEPSFLSSHSRPDIDLDEKFLINLWNWQGRFLLESLSVKMRARLSDDDYFEFLCSKMGIEGTTLLSYFSLGMAQHYGLPSVGLDLTDNFSTAICFASNSFKGDADNNLNVKKNENFNDSMIYVFRCPKNAVFSYASIKPNFFPKCRPDCQNAWFGNVGWGLAKNHMALYLACCIKVTENMYAEIAPNFVKTLFPSSKDDPVLAHFLRMKNDKHNHPLVQKVFSRIYDVND